MLLIKYVVKNKLKEKSFGRVQKSRGKLVRENLRRSAFFNIIVKWAKFPKNCLKECIFVNLALKIQRYIVKNTLLQTAFSVILPKLN